MHRKELKRLKSAIKCYKTKIKWNKMQMQIELMKQRALIKLRTRYKSVKQANSECALLCCAVLCALLSVRHCASIHIKATRQMALSVADFELSRDCEWVWVCESVCVCASLCSYTVGWLAWHGSYSSSSPSRRAAVKEKCLEKWQFTFVLHDVGRKE